MNIQLEAVVENELLRPLEPFDLPDKRRVRITVEDSDFVSPREPIAKASPTHTGNVNGTEQPNDPNPKSPLDTDDSDSRPWRGVFVVDTPRDIIGETKIDVLHSDLPTWEPLIPFNPRWFRDDDE